MLLPEGGHSFVGGHGSIGSVSSSLMGVTLGYPSGHPDPHSSIIASVVESQSTTGSTATGISTTITTATDTSTDLLARQPPIGIETAAATNPTLFTHAQIRNGRIDSNQILHINSLGGRSNIFDMTSKLVEGFRSGSVRKWASPIDFSFDVTL